MAIRTLSEHSVRTTMHFFVNFVLFKWLYLAYYWVYLHQTWGFCKTCSALYELLVYRLVPSPSRFENGPYEFSVFTSHVIKIIVTIQRKKSRV